MEKLCRIRDLQREINRFEQSFMQQYGICLNEGMVLCSLSKAGRLSAGELGELLGLTSSNVSKVIRSVEEKKLIERSFGTTDKRVMNFSLSPHGSELLGRIECADLDLPVGLNS